MAIAKERQKKNHSRRTGNSVVFHLSWGGVKMLEKLIITVTLTFSLHLLLSDRPPSPSAAIEKLQGTATPVASQLESKNYQ